MKLIHLSDLHLGKRVNEFPMLDDQEYILREILQIIDDEQPDGVLIAGDVYDKSIPPTEAVELLDNFLFQLSERHLQVFLISGNHDSPERTAFGGRLMQSSGIHLAPVYNGEITPTELTDDYGPLYIYLLPFIKPAHVRRFFQDQEIISYTDAISTVIQEMYIDSTVRNILVTHQFVTGASRSDSEDISVGGTDNVNGSIFGDFDYVALGHLHRPQNVGSSTIRYSGTPLKYSFSEASDQKSVTIIELKEKGNTTVRTVPLKPLRDLIELRGTYDELTLQSFYENTDYQSSYLHITLTDEDDVPDAMRKLQTIYPYLMKLDYDNHRTRSGLHIDKSDDPHRKSPLQLLDEFYTKQNGQPLSDTARDFAKHLMEEIWEDKE